MTLRGAFLLLSLVLGDIPTILAAAQVFGFMPTKIENGEGTAGVNMNPVRLFDIAFDLHEKSSKYLKEHTKEPETTTSQPQGETIMHPDKSPYGYTSMASNKVTDKPAFLPVEEQSYFGSSSPTPLDNSNIAAKENSSNEMIRDFDNEGGSDEDVVGYSYCNEESDSINCKYVSDSNINGKNETQAVTNTSLPHQHNSYTAVNNFNNIDHDGSAVLIDVRPSVNISRNNSEGANNGTNNLHNITVVFDATTKPVHEKPAEVTTEPTKASTFKAPEQQFPALKALPKPRTSYEYLIAMVKSKTESDKISDYNIYDKPHISYIPLEAYQMPRWNTPARNMCLSNCGQNGYCDNTLDPIICVCNTGYSGVPPDCYQPSAYEILQTYRSLLRRNSNKSVSSTNSPTTVDNKKQQIKFVLKGNKASASSKK